MTAPYYTDDQVTRRGAPVTEDQHDLEACRQVLLKGMADQGIEVTVSTARPLIVTAYDSNPMRCPHGTWFYMQPTSEQTAQWSKDGIR